MPESGLPPYAWWTTSTVYQIYPRSFADSDGDGIGDLVGITSRLDYLEQLGVDVLWLSPVYPSPHDDNGYDISDYRDIDPIFGTLSAFDDLLAAVHQRGMKLVMDLVVNHTSDEHPWFVESRSSRDNPKRDWYWWRPARPGNNPGEPGAEPTNWSSFFSGSTWDFDDATGEYYLHLFSPKQPDLNWENPAVRSAIYQMMRWWLDRGVDGFRIDVANMLSKDVSLPDGVVRPGSRYGDGFPFFIGGPRIHEFYAEMHREVFARYDPRPLTVGETPLTSVAAARLYTDPARHELDMVFQFEHVGVDRRAGKWGVIPLSLPALKESFTRWQDGLADVGWNSLYLENHDQPRSVSRFGDDGAHRVRSAKALATALHLQRGTPYVYQGQELGMTNAPFESIVDFRDIESRRRYDEAIAAGRDPAEVVGGLRVTSRDNARTPMQWDASRNAGFSTGEPWISVNPNYVGINAAAAVADPDSVFHHYRQLIALRRRDPVVAYGDYAVLLPEHEQIFAFTRTLGDEMLLTLCNFSSDEVVAELDQPEQWKAADVVISNLGVVDSGTTSAAVTDSGISLQPWEAIVLRRPIQRLSNDGRVK